MIYWFSKPSVSLVIIWEMNYGFSYKLQLELLPLKLLRRKLYGLGNSHIEQIIRKKILTIRLIFLINFIFVLYSTTLANGAHIKWRVLLLILWNLNCDGGTRESSLCANLLEYSGMLLPYWDYVYSKIFSDIFQTVPPNLTV